MMLHLRAGRALKDIPAHHGVDLNRAPARNAPATGGAAATAAWEVPVLQTVAVEGKGVVELANALDRHREWLHESGIGGSRRAARTVERVRDVVQRALRRIVWDERGGRVVLDACAADLRSGKMSPYDAASRIIRDTIGA
jgi:LAO/AO transport system kinase